MPASPENSGCCEHDLPVLCWRGSGEAARYRHSPTAAQASRKRCGMVHADGAREGPAAGGLSCTQDSEIKIGIYDQFKLMYLDFLSDKFNRFEYSSYSNLLKRYKLYQEVKEQLI